MKKKKKDYETISPRKCKTLSPANLKTHNKNPKQNVPSFYQAVFMIPQKHKYLLNNFEIKTFGIKIHEPQFQPHSAAKKTPPAPLSRSPHSHPAPKPKIPPAVTHPSKLLLFKTNHPHQQFPAHPKPTNKTTTALRLQKHKRKSRKQATYRLILQQKDADSSQKSVGRKHIKHKKKEKRKKQQKRG